MDKKDVVDIVRIIVGGTTFMTDKKTLARFPDSLLSNENAIAPYYEPSIQAYFFDRNPKVFHYVLDCYRTGDLHFASDICIESVVKELEFWQLDPTIIVSPCCLGPFEEYDERQRFLQDVSHETEWMAEGLTQNEENTFSTKLWIFMECPTSSRAAQFWTLLQIFLIYVLMVIYALITATWSSSSRAAPENGTVYETRGKIRLPYFNLRVLDIVIQVFFTIDLIVRCIIAPKKKLFLKQATTIVDFFCVGSYWICFTYNSIMIFTFMMNRHTDMTMRSVMIGIQLTRLIKISKLSSNSVQLRTLLLTLKNSVGEIVVLNMCFVAVMYMFAVAVYYADYRDEDSQLVDIPISFWWALITTTTVGYGDVTPHSVSGYIVGGLCALTGILLTGLAISILANNLNTYSQLTTQQDRAQKTMARRMRVKLEDHVDRNKNMEID